MSEHPLDALGQWVDAVDEDCGDPDCADCTPGRTYLAALRAVEQLEQAARGALRYARRVDLDCAEWQGGFPHLDAAVALFDRKEQT